MPKGFADPSEIRSYHAHIYYDPATRPVAERLRRAIGERFAVELGRWHDDPVGPHPAAMYQVAFPVGEFAQLVPWLMLNRNGLNVLVHPQAANAYDDHATHAMWLGTPLPLKLEVLRRDRG
jgi:aromatic ring-cleaving dioxygenase